MKNMRKTKERFKIKFLNLENKLVENQRQIMYDKIRNFKKKRKF